MCSSDLSPFADVIVYLSVEILIVGMVGITLHAILPNDAEFARYKEQMKGN